jgi:hypothetical protein
MLLTKSFDERVQRHATGDPAFGKALARDYIRATTQRGDRHPAQKPDPHATDIIGICGPSPAEPDDADGHFSRYPRFGALVGHRREQIRSE